MIPKYSRYQHLGSKNITVERDFKHKLVNHLAA